MSETSSGMKGMPAIDMAYLARQTAGDHDLEQELLALFADQCVRHLATLHSDDAGRGRDAAHTLKGAARAIGAWNVANAAEKVEDALARHTGNEEIGELELAAEQARAAIAEMQRAS